MRIGKLRLEAAEPGRRSPHLGRGPSGIYEVTRISAQNSSLLAVPRADVLIYMCVRGDFIPRDSK